MRMSICKVPETGYSCHTEVRYQLLRVACPSCVMSSNGWTAAGCGAHVCSLERQRITATRNWQPARWKTHHFREGTDLLNFHQLAVIRIHPEVVGFPQPLPLSLLFCHLTHLFFSYLGFTVFLSLTRRWQRNQFGKLLKKQTQPLFGNRICCDWTWIRRNRRLHGWSRSGCWNRRRRPSRILKRFSRVPWKMGWSYAGCWSDSARAPRRK